MHLSGFIFLQLQIFRSVLLQELKITLHFRIELDPYVKNCSWIVANCHFHLDMAQDCAVQLCYFHLTSFVDIFEFNQDSYMFFMRDHEKYPMPFL